MSTASQAQRPFVLALDVGTSSVRALLYDAQGRAIEGAESRIAYQMQTTQDGGVEMDADELCVLTCRTIDELLERAGAIISDLREALCGVALSTFWHSLLGIGPDGRAVTPLYNWSDTRSAADADVFSQLFGVEWIHSRTGTVPHASYYPAKLLWLWRTDPALYTRVARWMSFGEYFHLQLFGQTRWQHFHCFGHGGYSIPTPARGMKTCFGRWRSNCNNFRRWLKTMNH